jgi:predicted ribosome quality control (RQC) complex YloA/Tae2 family protein
VNRETISKLVDELRSSAIGHELIRAIPSGPHEISLHLRDAEPPFILISCDPKLHRIIPVRRRLRDLEKAGTQTPFSLLANRDLVGTRVTGIEMLPDDRIVSIHFDSVEPDAGKFVIVAQLTGKSSNVFLLDNDMAITSRMRDTSGPGQEVGSPYAPPITGSESVRTEHPDEFHRHDDESFADSVDRHYSALISSMDLQSAANAERGRIRAEAKKLGRLIESLKSDLKSHGDAETWKKYGDLLLANANASRRDGDEIFVTDYFDPESPEICIPGDANKPVTQIAEDYFKKYVKARNAKAQLSERIAVAEREMATIQNRLDALEKSVAEGTFVAKLKTSEGSVESRKGGRKPNKTRSPFRRFLSSDGIEILVGKGSRDNDELTFKVAKSLDLWLHAADYPGSHVIVRGAGKKEIPQSTLIEAAKLAAFYSDAKNQPKAAVHHTQRKFVNKIKGAAPGLVRLSSFKTVMVEPEIPSGTSRDQSP